MQIPYNDQGSTYEECLLKAGKTTVNISRLKIIRTEILKRNSNLKMVYTKYIFSLHMIT